MKIASLSELKKEIKHLETDELIDLVSRMAKFSKENKELLNYLLFESDFESNYVDKIKENINQQFAELNVREIRYLKKGLQRMVREIKKRVKYSANKQTEIEVWIHFCQQISVRNIRISRYPVLINLYNRQLKTVEKAISSLDEDLQYDYREDFLEIESFSSNFWFSMHLFC